MGVQECRAARRELRAEDTAHLVLADDVIE
jgi:hypothetical protein